MLVLVLFFFVIFVFVVGLLAMVFLFFVPVGMSGHSIIATQVADGNAEESTLAYERKPGGAALHILAAARQNPEGLLFMLVLFVLVFVLVFVAFLFVAFFFVLLFLHGPQQRRFGVARYLVVVGLAAKPVKMPGKVAGAAVQPERAVACIAVVRPAQIQFSA